MHSFMRSSISNSYNPAKNNNLTDINRLLISRNTVCQKKACEFIIAEINRYEQNNDRKDLIRYLLENDSVIFLCEATGNMDFSLIRLILHCMRLLWSDRQYFEEEPAAQSMSAVLRVLAHYASGGEMNAVDTCLEFLRDLLESIKHYETTSPLCHQSTYSAEQLLACFKTFASKINKTHTSILLSGLVIHALISYKPSNLIIGSSNAIILVEVIKQWFALLLGALNTSSLVEEDISRKFFVLMCHIGKDSLGLAKVLKSGYHQKMDFVNKIIINEDEVNVLRKCSIELNNSVYDLILELVTVNKNYQGSATAEEYEAFLEFLLLFFYEHSKTETLTSFCEVLIKEGYLTMLPKQLISRKDDGAIRKLSTLILGEILKALSEKYLKFNTQEEWDDEIFVKHINICQSDIQYGLEKPESIGTQLMKEQPYSLLIYMYFYCQSSDSFQEATPSLLPHLMNHILRLPECPFVPPPYIIKVLWLVFAMATVKSEDFSKWCIDEKVRLEKATERLVNMLRPDSSLYYTHNPAILGWAYTSLRIPRFVRLQVLKQWLSIEEFVPICLIKRFAIQKDLVDILLDECNIQLAANCIRIIQECANYEDSFATMANFVWSKLPKVLTEVLIKINEQIDSSSDYLPDLAALFLPQVINEADCKEVAQLVAAIFSKTNLKYSNNSIESRYHHEIVYLKLARILLNLSCSHNNIGVLLTYLNRAGFLPNVLTAIHSLNDRVACEALHLLYYIVYYFNTYNLKPQPLGQVPGLQMHLIIHHLRRDGSNERGVALLRLVEIILDSGFNTPLALTYDVPGLPSDSQQCNMLKALMLRIQMMCCKGCENESSDIVSIGWKTLNSLYKYASITQNDTKLLTTLTSQPWICTLIQFQITKNTPEEFLVFLNNWLILINMTLEEILEKKPRQFCKQSLIGKTLMALLKHFLEEKDITELKRNIVELLKDVLTFCGFNVSLDKATV